MEHSPKNQSNMPTEHLLVELFREERGDGARVSRPCQASQDASMLPMGMQNAKATL